MGGRPSMVVADTFSPGGKIRRLSMAPLLARIPQLTEPPSKAGPAEAEQATRNSLLPSTTSPLVPMSSSSASSSLRCMPEASTPAVMSPPTKLPAMGKV